jgi:hypothetical protein
VAVGTIVDDDPRPPRLGIRLLGDAVQLSWNTNLGWTYTLQSATNLTSPVAWTDLPPHIDLPGSGDTSSVTVNPDTAVRFFRIKATSTDP